MRRFLIYCVMPPILCAIMSLTSFVGLCAAANDHPAEASSQVDHESSNSHNKGAPLDLKGDLALWSLVVFIVFILVLKKFAWGPLLEGLDKREAGIRRDIEDAEAAHEKAAALLAEHEYKMDKVQDEIREILAEARRDAEHTRQEMLTAAKDEAEATKQRAIHDIQRARDEALDELFSHMATSVTLATQAVLGRALTAADDGKLIDEALSEFSPSRN